MTPFFPCQSDFFIDFIERQVGQLSALCHFPYLLEGLESCHCVTLW